MSKAGSGVKLPRVPPDLASTVAKAFRVRGPGARRCYSEARRLGRFFRDRRRRQVLAGLRETVPTLEIRDDTGFLLVAPDALTECREIAAGAMALVAADAAEATAGTRSGKRFLQNLLDRRSIGLTSPLMRLALRPDVLTAVSRYLRVVPLLTTLSVFRSEPRDPELKSSQLFHCDGDDVRQVKVFIYCSDVDMASGPLTILDATTSRRVMSATGYQFRQRLSDEDVVAVAGDARGVPIVGRTGSTVFVDTSRCFHFGSRVLPGAPARIAAMIQYQTPYSFMLPERSLPYRHLADDSLSELQRLVLGA